MKTIGWWIKKPEEDFFLALYGDVALLAKTSFVEQVWQFRSSGGQRVAIRRLVELTEDMESSGGRMQGEPVEFTLSPAALYEIRDDRDFMMWPTAPLLRLQLMQLISGSILTAKPPLEWQPAALMRSLLVDDIARIYTVPKGMIA